MPRHPRSPVFSLLPPALVGTLALLTACSTTPAASSAATTDKSAAAPPPGASPRIASFSVSPENLNVDKVGLRDGFLRPDGNRDLAFSASVEGPYDALFLISVNAKGEPAYGLRADTLTGGDEIPPELGGVIDTGKMTVGMGVAEDGKFINGESGSAHGAAGLHNLTLYVPNVATVRPGSFVRLYARVGGGPLVPGPITPY